MVTSAKQRIYRILRWSEKYTKTDMVFVASTSGWALVAQAASSLASFALALIVAHHVSKVEYGTYQYILSVVGLLTMVSLTGLGSAVMQSVAKGFDRSLEDGFALNLRWSGAVFVGAIALGGYYAMAGNYLLAIGMAVAGLTIPFRSGFSLYSSFLNGKKDTVRSALWVTGIGNIFPILIVGLCAFIAPQAIFLVLAYVFGNLAINIYLYRRVRRIYPKMSGPTDTGLASYSKHMSVANIFGAIAGSIDNLLLFHYLGAAEVAIYNFAVALADQMKAPIGSIGTMMTARFASHTPQAIQSSLRNKLVWITLFHIVIVGGLFLITPIFFHLLFPRYVESIPYAQAYALSLFSGILLMPASAYLAAHKKTQEQYIVSAGSSIFQIASLCIGTIWYGLWGLVFARIVSRFFGAILTYALYIRASHADMTAC